MASPGCVQCSVSCKLFFGVAVRNFRSLAPRTPALENNSQAAVEPARQRNSLVSSDSSLFRS